MALVKVWNDNVFPYKENFKDEKIFINAKDFIEMENDDAVLFKGTFCSPSKDAGGGFKPETFKMIRIEQVKKPVARTSFFKCQACGKELGSAVELDKHITKEHSDILIEDEEKKKRTK